MRGRKKVNISKAIQILRENHLKILTVYEWAYVMGYTRSHFSRIFKKEFGMCPKDKLKVFRLQLIKKELKRSPKAKGYKIAVNAGLANEKSLHKFLYTNFDKNLTVLKQEISLD